MNSKHTTLNFTLSFVYIPEYWHFVKKNHATIMIAELLYTLGKEYQKHQKFHFDYEMLFYIFAFVTLLK